MGELGALLCAVMAVSSFASDFAVAEINPDCPCREIGSERTYFTMPMTSWGSCEPKDNDTAGCDSTGVKTRDIKCFHTVNRTEKAGNCFEFETCKLPTGNCVGTWGKWGSTGICDCKTNLQNRTRYCYKKRNENILATNCVGSEGNFEQIGTTYCSCEFVGITLKKITTTTTTTIGGFGGTSTTTARNLITSNQGSTTSTTTTTESSKTQINLDTIIIVVSVLVVALIVIVLFIIVLRYVKKVSAKRKPNLGTTPSKVELQSNNSHPPSLNSTVRSYRPQDLPQRMCSDKSNMSSSFTFYGVDEGTTTLPHHPYQNEYGNKNNILYDPDGKPPTPPRNNNETIPSEMDDMHTYYSIAEARGTS